MRLGVAVVALFVAVLAAPARAEILPEADPYEDAGKVPLIVEARVVDGDRVAVVKTLYAEKPLAADVRELRVEGLARHSRKLGFLDEKSPPLDAKDVVLLLVQDEFGDWKPYEMILDDSFGGSCGAYFVKDGKVWCYRQEMRPGPLVLQPWRAEFRGPQGTIDALRAELAAGVAVRRTWDEDLATADPVERAKKLVRWLRAATSPDGGHRGRKFAVRKETTKIGAPAVAALVAALSFDDDEEARELALCAIADIGAAAKDAVPRLLEIAETPGKQRPDVVAYALAGVRDARTIPALRKLLADAPVTDDNTLQYAAEGLVRVKDAEAADRIVAKFPADLDDPKATNGVLELLRALHSADDAKARAWLKPRRKLVVFKADRDLVEYVMTTRSDGTGLHDAR